jgi:hypothetical protein
MKVKNVNGISTDTCKCGNWLDHWKNFSEQALPRFCPEWGCLEKPEVGAHVQKDGSSDTGWYIVPLCREHYVQTGRTITIDDSVKLVPANICIPRSK